MGECKVIVVKAVFFFGQIFVKMSTAQVYRAQSNSRDE